MEYHLWGLKPVGFHVTNLLLHIGVALLLWRILIRLQIPCALLAACVFAVFFFQQKTAYEMAQCDWSLDVCSSDLLLLLEEQDRSRWDRDQLRAGMAWLARSAV